MKNTTKAIKEEAARIEKVKSADFHSKCETIVKQIWDKYELNIYYTEIVYIRDEDGTLLAGKVLFTLTDNGIVNEVIPTNLIDELNLNGVQEEREIRFIIFVD